MDAPSEEVMFDFITHTDTVLDSFSESELDEQTTKQYLVSNFLEDVLQWPVSVISGEYRIKSEYPVRMASQKKKVDYALVNDDNDALCIVEAKSIRVSLGESEKQQLKSYMKSEELIWGILTNGREYCFYIRDDKDTIKENEISHTTYSNLDSITNLLGLYLFDNITTGKSDSEREHILQQYRRVKTFDKDETVNTLSDVLNPQSSEERELIANFVDEYESIISQHQNPTSDTSQETDIEELTFDIESEEIVNNTCLEFEDSAVVFNSDSARANVESVLEYLFDAGYLQEKHLPLSRGRTRYLLNRDPVNQYTEEMIHDRELSNGVFFESNYSTKDCKQIIKELTGVRVD